MKKTKVSRMLVHLDAQYEAARKMLNGILRFAATNSRWEVQFTDRELPYANLSFYGEWKPDAIITDCRCHTIDSESFAAIGSKIAVFVSTEPPQGWNLPCAIIESDDALIGKTAASFFRHKKIANYAYIGDSRQKEWDKARHAAFCETLGEDHAAVVHRFGNFSGKDWSAQEKAIAKWLKSLPKPCGLFAAYDMRGKHVLDACRIAGISVPEQIQVLGVDDESHICEQTAPTLSSIAPDFEAGGFTAAKFVDGVLCGGDTPPQPGNPRRLKFGVKGVVERMSTTDIYGMAQRITAAKRFIRQYATTQIGTGDVAAAIGVSQRVLQRNFKEITGKTVLDEIQTVRLEKAKDMLRKTNIPVNNLSAFCGFSSASHLKRLFKAKFGMTMSAWRSSSGR